MVVYNAETGFVTWHAYKAVLSASWILASSCDIRKNTTAKSVCLVYVDYNPKACLRPPTYRVISFSVILEVGINTRSPCSTQSNSTPQKTNLEEVDYSSMK